MDYEESRIETIKNETIALYYQLDKTTSQEVRELVTEIIDLEIEKGGHERTIKDREAIEEALEILEDTKGKVNRNEITGNDIYDNIRDAINKIEDK